MLAGRQVTIGPFVPGDYAPLHRWANDAAVLRDDGPFQPTQLSDIVNLCETADTDPSRRMFAIRKLADPAIIGYVHIQNINAIHRAADIGIRIGEESDRGRGYGQDALRVALDYCWNQLELQRVMLTVVKQNTRAIAAYRSVGFVKEGLLRKFLFVDGDWIDVVIMATFRPKRRRASAGKSAAPENLSNLGTVRRAAA
jgi:RimJ/RimL family protein N-acetyltransferase